MVDPKLRALRQELRRFTYKVGSTFFAEKWRDQYFVGVRVPSKHDSVTRRPTPSHPYVVCSRWLKDNTFLQDGSIDVGSLAESVLYVIRDIELHEIDEWLRVDGEPVHPPHLRGKLQ
jgi:hypothetical protein